MEETELCNKLKFKNTRNTEHAARIWFALLLGFPGEVCDLVILK